jgi:hypothetical protein
MASEAKTKDTPTRTFTMRYHVMRDGEEFTGVRFAVPKSVFPKLTSEGKTSMKLEKSDHEDLFSYLASLGCKVEDDWYDYQVEVTSTKVNFISRTRQGAYAAFHKHYMKEYGDQRLTLKRNWIINSYTVESDNESSSASAMFDLFQGSSDSDDFGDESD